MLGSCCKSSFIREALMFRHPKYYKELRKLRNKSEQAISARETADDARAPAPGHKLQAASAKRQAPSSKSNKL